MGDEALRTLAAELKRMVGPDCVVARIGGDEFGVILPSACDAPSAQDYRRRFESDITCLIGPGHNSISVSASVGSALYPDDGTSSSGCLRLETSPCTDASADQCGPRHLRSQLLTVHAASKVLMDADFVER